MLSLKRPDKVKLICAFIYSQKEIYEETLKILRKKIGIIDLESSAIKFNFTDYYKKEMGDNLLRNFISFEKLIKPDALVNIKLYTVKIEKKFAEKRKRRINIDPGYINEAKLSLTTTKDFCHRLYIGRKIYAEITLYYANKQFKNLPWTFPDYRTPEYKEIFTKIRDKYKKQLRDGRK